MPSQGCFSTNWNSAELGSKRHTITSEIAKVTSVVHIATQRAVPRASPSLPRTSMMNSAPSSGRKVTTERMGQFRFMSFHRQHEPGDEGGSADQHGEGVVIEIAGLQPYHVARHIQHSRRNAVGPEAVDQPAVAALPEQAAECLGRLDENHVIDFVEVPFVEQEFVEHLVRTREFD